VRDEPFSEGGLDLAGLAATLGLPRPAAEHLTRAGLLPGIGVGADWFCSPEHLGAWMAEPPPDDEQRRWRQLLAPAGREA
jgi:hypothetical protein